MNSRSAGHERYQAVTDSTGLATVQENWGANVYSVNAAFPGDVNYLSCAASYQVLVTVMAAQAKATGGGWFSNSVGRTAFGFNAISDVTGLHGQLQLRTPNKGNFHGSTITSLTGTVNTATWSGTGVWNGQPNYRYSVSVYDAGTSVKATDTFSITITSPTGSQVFTTNGPQKLKGGNIVVH